MLIAPVLSFAQIGSGTSNTGGNNQNNSGGNNQNNSGGNSSPYYTNPYNQNPYSNPYMDQNQNNQNQNFFNNQNNQNNPQGNNPSNPPVNPNQPNQPLNFQDLNKMRNNAQDQRMLEMYKNDPDYIKYMNADPQIIIEDTNKTSEYKDSLDNAKKAKRKVFGSDFFSNNVFDLSDRAPSSPPVDYRLGPGDELIVSIWGNSEYQNNYTIGKDGAIFPRLVGKVYVQGMTLEEATRMISNRFRKVIAANSSVDVQMGKARTIRVTVLGEVKKQGTYTISAFNTALNALYRAGGVTDIGNMRRIEIKRDGRTVDIIDLYQYLQKNKQAEEVYLEDNDFIYVDVFEKLVKAEGNFKRPMYYQMKNDEGLRDLIQLSGGASSNARNSLIHIKTIVNEEEKYIDIPGQQYFDENSMDDLVLNDGDVVTFKSINDGLKNIVTIEGDVNYPDEYEVKFGDKISKVLQRAGGLSPSAYQARVFVFRGSNSVESNAIKVNLLSLAEHPEDDIAIMPGDRIKVLSNKDFEQSYHIQVIGYVRKPGKIPYYKNMRLKDLLLLSGGLKLEAENGRIEISNIVDTFSKYSINSSKSNVKIISINANLELDQASEEIIINPMDRVYIRRKTEFLSQEKVIVMGEVAYPGEYVLVEKNERLSSVITRCGGVLPSSYAEGSKLIRSKIGPIVIDLPLAISKTGSKYDVVLKDSDILIIPSINDIVSIRGEVQSSVNIKFDRSNNDLLYYIGASGGFGERPWKNRINVRYQNGRIKNTKNFLFVRVYPKIKEGSTITVPTKPKKENTTKFSEVFSYSLSALTTLATLLLLSKNL